jgi:ornithine cyclodeaminase/alanine dehydrogenase-like protein (mu-crystallin family)
VDAGAIARDGVTELGAILLGHAPGREGGEITVFDSTGLAVQDLAVARLVYERYREEPGAPAFDGIVEISLT